MKTATAKSKATKPDPNKLTPTQLAMLKDTQWHNYWGHWDIVRFHVKYRQLIIPVEALVESFEQVLGHSVDAKWATWFEEARHEFIKRFGELGQAFPAGFFDIKPETVRKPLSEETGDDSE